MSVKINRSHTLFRANSDEIVLQFLPIFRIANIVLVRQSLHRHAAIGDSNIVISIKGAQIDANCVSIGMVNRDVYAREIVLSSWYKVEIVLKRLLLDTPPAKAGGFSVH